MYRLAQARRCRVTTPRRIQLRRTRGFRLRDISQDAVVVSRPSKWGNPIRITRERNTDRYGPRFMYRVHGSPLDRNGGPAYCDLGTARYFAASYFEADLINGRYPDYPSLTEIRAELAGRDVACWCPPRKINRSGTLGQINCHGDIAAGAWGDRP